MVADATPAITPDDANIGRYQPMIRDLPTGERPRERLKGLGRRYRSMGGHDLISPNRVISFPAGENGREQFSEVSGDEPRDHGDAYGSNSGESSQPILCP